MNNDREHLKILSIFHYIFGGLTLLGGCFTSIYAGVGVALVSGAIEDPQEEAPAAVIGWIFIVVALLAMLAIWIVAACIIMAGRALASYRRYTLCMVVACILLCFFPMGTILGVFTLVVLMRPSVKNLFETAGAAPAVPYESASPFDAS
jgi:hypothetical protein